MDVEEDSEQLAEFRGGLAAFSFTDGPLTSPAAPRRSSRKLANNALKAENDPGTLPTPLSPAGKGSRRRDSRASVTATTGTGKSTRKTKRAKSAKEQVLGPDSVQPGKVKLAEVRKVKAKRGYAPPEKYAHLRFLPNFLKEDLDILFCGINPAVRSSQIGHHYGHHSNHFWPCLVDSGLTNGEAMTALEDHTMVDRYNLGMTNLVDRPSAEAAELSNKEKVACVPSLLRKVTQYRPRILALVGKTIWASIDVTLRRGGQKPAKRFRSQKQTFNYDIQPYKLVHPMASEGAVRETLIFVLPSSSARVVHYQKEDKTELFTLLKQRLEELKAGRLDTSPMIVITPLLEAGDA